MEQRPTAVSIIAGFLLAATAVAAIVGTSLLFPGKLLDWLSQFNHPAMAAFQMLGRISGILLLALAVGAASAATGLIRRRTWAWWFTVILFSVNGCGDLVSFYVTGDAIKSISGIAICSVFLYVLGRHRVRFYFKKPY
jgi:lysylphosphatidylglycerol synthetase-like protein (DUF2156 family)